MNILLVNMSVDPVLGGGTVERTRQLLTELQKLPDTEAIVLSTTAGLNDDTILHDKQFVLLASLSDRWYIPAPSVSLIYRNIKWADIIILSGHWTLINAAIYFMNLIIKKPYVFCPAGALHIFGRSSILKRVYNAIAGTRILKGAKRVIAIPRKEICSFIELGVPKEKIVVIPNGISSENFISSDDAGFRGKYGLDNSPFLLFMGRLNEIKGPDLLVDVFISIARKFPGWQLVFAGPDGGMQNALEKKVDEQGLHHRIHFIGYVSGDDKSNAYHAAELLIIPSRLEAMSIVALEAGICGTPVIMTNECGFSEMVSAGGAIEVGVDNVLLMDALCLLMENPQTILKMGETAKSFIKKNYTWEMAAKQHRELCEKLLASEVLNT